MTSDASNPFDPTPTVSRLPRTTVARRAIIVRRGCDGMRAKHFTKADVTRADLDEEICPACMPRGFEFFVQMAGP